LKNIEKCDCVEILLSTFNGDKYIWQFFESLQKQSYKNWKIIIRDDGSGDDTPDIIRAFAERFGDRVKCVNNSEGNLGAQGSFSALMILSTEKYVMFADQDDVWLPHKIEVMIKKIKELESAYGEKIPLLVHSDLTVVDEDLTVISNSFWSYQGLHVNSTTSLSEFVVQNYVTGCATLVNRSLVLQASPVPPLAAMHDWWCALVAVTFGKIGILEEPTILYRQHNNNTVGAKRFNMLFAMRTFFHTKRKILSGIAKCVCQTEAFLSRYENMLESREQKCLQAFLNLKNQGFFIRKVVLFRNGFKKSGLLRTIGLYLFI
jgi:glycosyltransferase involved in cell wall biosynthesis